MLTWARGRSAIRPSAGLRLCHYWPAAVPSLIAKIDAGVLTAVHAAAPLALSLALAGLWMDYSSGPRWRWLVRRPAGRHGPPLWRPSQSGGMAAMTDPRSTAVDALIIAEVRRRFQHLRPRRRSAAWLRESALSGISDWLLVDFGHVWCRPSTSLYLWSASLATAMLCSIYRQRNIDDAIAVSGLCSPLLPRHCAAAQLYDQLRRYAATDISGCTNLNWRGRLAARRYIMKPGVQAPCGGEHCHDLAR